MMCITEGEVGRVGCPDPECSKDEGREVGEEEVRKVVGEEKVVGRWLRRKREVERGICVVL